MDVRESTIEATTDDGAMAVVVAEPKESSSGRQEWPVVLFFIDAPGLRPATRDFMARLAAEGYRVITPDLHHRHGKLLHFEPADSAADPSVRSTVSEWINSMTDDQIQHDADSALSAAAVSDNTPFATIGFCLGARAVYQSMQRHPERAMCGAGWHPSFLVDDTAESPHLTVSALDRPLYLGIGEADRVQSIEMHQRFLSAAAENPQVIVRTFPGVNHGYSWPGYPNYDQGAAEASWAITLKMFADARASDG